MKKETAIAIFLGITFGIIVAVIMIVKTRGTLTQNTKPVLTSTSVTPTAIPTPKVEVQAVQISQPENGDIVNAKSITIKGKATKDALIVIQSPIKTLTSKLTSDDFSFDFPLALGENAIHITVYAADKQETTSEKDLKVYYLDEQ